MEITSTAVRLSVCLFAAFVGVIDTCAAKLSHFHTRLRRRGRPGKRQYDALNKVSLLSVSGGVRTTKKKRDTVDKGG